MASEIKRVHLQRADLAMLQWEHQMAEMIPMTDAPEHLVYHRSGHEGDESVQHSRLEIAWQERPQVAMRPIEALKQPQSTRGSADAPHQDGGRSCSAIE
jgi:hypothetical protein